MLKIKNIVLAVELTGDKTITDRAVALAKKFGSKITLVHAIEHISAYGAAYGIAVGAEIEEVLLKYANRQMLKLGKQIGVPVKNQIVKFGSAKIVILEEANKIKADLIVVGSHGRHGITLLLGSTANAVLHGAKCDVLAVRIRRR
jgi:universal stress protein A